MMAWLSYGGAMMVYLLSREARTKQHQEMIWKLNIAVCQFGRTWSLIMMEYFGATFFFFILWILFCNIPFSFLVWFESILQYYLIRYLEVRNGIDFVLLGVWLDNVVGNDVNHARKQRIVVTTQPKNGYWSSRVELGYYYYWRKSQLGQ